MTASAKPNILGVIPARGGSKGLAGKNIRLLGSAPLLHYAIGAARDSRLLTDFFVSTDDDAIAQSAADAGSPVPFLRPTALAQDDTPIWPVVRHATAFWENRSGRRAQAVVILQPTAPLRLGTDIDGCVERLFSLKADACVSVTPSHDSPFFNMVEMMPGAEPFVRPLSTALQKSIRRQDAPPVYALNGAVYAVQRDSLETIESLFLLAKVAVFQMPRSRSIDIDTEDDLALAEFWLERIKRGVPHDA